MTNSEKAETDNNASAAAVDLGPHRDLQWTAYPLRDFPPLKSMALAVLVAGVLTAVKATFIDWWWVIFAAAILMLSMSKYLLPTYYEFNHSELVVRHLGLAHRRPWQQFKTFEECSTGVFLSPFARRSVLENFRGLYVLFGPRNRNEVMAFVRTILQKEK